MTNTGVTYIKINTWLLSSIWTRKPVIVYSKDPRFLKDYFNELNRFFPKYRQPILVGKFPKAVQYGFSKPKLVNNSSPQDVQEMLLNIFEEERSLESRSLQLVVWDPPEEFFSQVLSHLDRGWITFTTLDPRHLQKFFPDCEYETYAISEDLDAVFICGRPYRVPIELEIVKNYFSRSPISSYFLIQKKLHEIKYVADAIVSEIGHGKKFHQVEIQELFELDNQNFEKCMQIIEAEFHLDVNRYITRTSNQIKKILRKMIELEGVIYACAFRNQQLTGIVKSRPDVPFPLSFYEKLIHLSQNLKRDYLPGTLNQVVFELNRKTKIIFLSNQINNSSQICFGFFLNPRVLVPSFIREVTNLIATIAG